MYEYLDHFQVLLLQITLEWTFPYTPTAFDIWINGLLEQLKNFVDIAKLTSECYTSLQSNYQYMRVSVSPHLHQQWESSNFLIIDNLLCEKWISSLLSFLFQLWMRLNIFSCIYWHSIYFYIWLSMYFPIFLMAYSTFIFWGGSFL